ncbi:MAG TPA: alpha/beta hydrolase [Pseudolabrys sp.]|nr:alpha/beta hydrolase [Pseudolabrys sp.]
MLRTIDGNIDYEESGAGPTIVFVPGSCSTAAAWRPVIAELSARFRCVATSLPGYGGTRERRSPGDCSIWHPAEAVEAVVRHAGGPVHLVGHSFGGLVALAVAVRQRVALQSLTVVEAPAPDLLRACGELNHYLAFRAMTESYFAAYDSGDQLAIARMIDFYEGPNAFAALPPRVRSYAVETTPVNRWDWLSAYSFGPSPTTLSGIGVPTLVMIGENSHPAAQRANELLCVHIRDAALAIVRDAAHFMISTHGKETAKFIASHVTCLEEVRPPRMVSRDRADCRRG